LGRLRRHPESKAWIDKDVLLDPTCIIGQGACLYGDVKVQERVRIESNAVIHGPVSIGAGSFVGSNVILGFPPKSELAKLMNRGGDLHRAPDRGELTIGRECIIRSGTCVYSGVSIGDRVSFGHNVLVRENVHIGKHTLIGTNVVIDGSSEIGERVSIQTGAYICTNCKIEDSVFLGPHVVLTNDKYVTQKKTELVGPTIRRGASVGANALLMPSIEVGEGSVVGAQSLVTGNVPPYTIYAGIPAKKLKRIPPGWRTSLLAQ